MLPFLDEAQTAHEGMWHMHICMQGRWFGNVFLLPHGRMKWKGTETRESSWRMVLPMKVQFFYEWRNKNTKFRYPRAHRPSEG